MNIPCVMYPDRSNCFYGSTFLHLRHDGSVTICVQSTMANADVKLSASDAIDIAERILRAFAPDRLAALAEPKESNRE